LDSWCNDKQVCTAYLPIGAPCTSSEQCGDNNGCDDTTKVCVQVSHTQQPAGGSCKTDKECGKYKCVNSLCDGVNLGGMCMEATDCNPPNFCNETSMTCDAPSPPGSKCDVQLGNCDPLHYCAPVKIGANPTCLPFGSAQVGSPCTDQSDCPDGSGCYTPSQSQDEIGTCVKVGTSSGTSCYNDSVCHEYESCQCNIGTGKRICLLDVYPNSVGSRANLMNVVDCIYENCPTGATGCINTACETEYCKYAEGMYKSIYTYYGESYPKCLTNWYLNHIPQMLGCPTTS